MDPNWASDIDYRTWVISVVADMDANDTAYVQFHQGGGVQQTDISVISWFSGVLIC